MPRIVTVLQTRALNALQRGSSEYNVSHVQALARQIERYAPFVHFEVLSDVKVPGVETIPLRHNWPGWWSKMELMRPDLPGDFLFLDLDTVILGPLDDILAVNKLALLRDFYRNGVKLKEGLGGGLMYFPADPSVRFPVWDFWMQQPQLQMKVYGRGDQFLFEKFWLGSAARFQDLVPAQVVSWKVDCAKGVPPGARIVAFHGRPKPWEVGQFLDLYR